MEETENRIEPLPLPTIRRYPSYLREIRAMVQRGELHVSSAVIAESESSSLQVDGHRAAYQTQTNDSYYHIIVALMSLRQARRPNISVTESSVAELAIAEPVAELVGC